MKGPKPRSIYDRWLEKVEKTDGCWLWRGARIPKGYGTIGSLNSRETVYAHRFAYEHFVGVIPDGMFVLHSCNTPACVNPAHLRLGTAKENSEDMVEAGRSARGEKASHARLTVADVLAIRAGTRLYKEIAAEYGVSIGTVCDIKKRRTWAHVGAEP